MVLWRRKGGSTAIVEAARTILDLLPYNNKTWYIYPTYEGGLSLESDDIDVELRTKDCLVLVSVTDPWDPDQDFYGRLDEGSLNLVLKAIDAALY